MAQKKQKNKREPRKRVGLDSYYSAHIEFQSSMTALYKYIDVVTTSMLAHTDEVNKQIDDIDTKLEKLATPETREDQEDLIMLLRKRASLVSPVETLLPKGTLILAISFFENHLSALIKEFLFRNPTAVSKDRYIGLEDLGAAKSLDDLKNTLIGIQARSVINKSVSDWEKYVQSVMGIDLDHITNLFDQLNEIHQRRNIVVHNNAIVDKQYIQSVSSDLQKEYGVKLGESLPITIEYLLDAVDTICSIGFYLLQSCWRKWVPDDEGLCNFYIVDQVYFALCDERHSLVEKMVVAHLPVLPSDSYDLQVLMVNRCIALRDTGQGDLLREQISTFQWNRDEDRIMLAVAILEEDFGKARSLMENGLEGSPLREVHLDDWPLFIPLRSLPEFTVWFGNRDQASSL